MAVRGIVFVGDELLRKVSHPVTRFDERLHRLLGDMWDTLRQEEGAGLAAVQIGVLRRITVIDMGDGSETLELINPLILSVEGSSEGIEGCLSVPEKRYRIARPQRVVVRAQDRNGAFFEAVGEGMKARCFVHEIEHMDGILFTDHVAKGAQSIPDDSADEAGT